MASKYPQFDRDRLDLKPLSMRKSEMTLDGLLDVGEAPEAFAHADLPAVAKESVYESGKMLQKANGILSISHQADTMVLELGSGRYDFESRLP